ncbi:hypothetical protein LOTGIDRAFT_114691 [Lottia gigantea]|uniref:Potassium channel domain-containing protein n=1 Tax=Lottia gigantea TaxID=225164 RepID=V4C8V4_LOTGI|nr:hypothetical protein LOTGIDRAFT_114691 [Lottia gigantea]ESO98184.1 hypothetical protein LOTGIDRAFT_114691 [Lottia gigantea]
MSPTKRKFENISYKLSHRKKLLNRRRMVVNIEFALAMLGIILMLIETECFIDIPGFTKADPVSVILKSFISISTFFLIICVISYHIVGIQIRMTDGSLEDWRLALSSWTYVKIATEVIICAIHPIPGDISFPYAAKNAPKRVSIDAFLSVLMLLRLYLVGKFVVIHSRLLTDTSTQSLGALNKVKINTGFVFKALMSERPGSMLVALMFAIFVINSWALRTCEVYYHPDHEHSDFTNAMWLIAITFLTIGYGDITPNSECGRFIAVETGLMGVGITALLVAVLAQKLEQTRSEKYVHTFVNRVKLDNAQKHAASNVIKQVLSLWRIKRRGIKDDKYRIRVYGKMLQALREMRAARNGKAIIGETSIGIIEVSKSVNDVFDITETIQTEQREIKSRLDGLENTVKTINDKLDIILNSSRR